MQVKQQVRTTQDFRDFQEDLNEVAYKEYFRRVLGELDFSECSEAEEYLIKKIVCPSLPYRVAISSLNLVYVLAHGQALYVGELYEVREKIKKFFKDREDLGLYQEVFLSPWSSAFRAYGNLSL